MYPNRPDPYEASGWSALCEEQREGEDGVLGILRRPRNKDLQRRIDQAHKVLRRMEREYEQEEEQMMIRLIRVRNSLWT